VRDQELEGRRAVVGEGADDLAVVVAVVRVTVRLHDRPVGQVLEHEVGRVLDAVFLLHTGAAAERHVAAADPRVAADVRLRFDHDHRGARLFGDDGGRQPAGAGADHHDVGFFVPLDRRLLCLGGLRARAGGQCGDRAALQEHIASVDGHGIPPVLFFYSRAAGALRGPAARRIGASVSRIPPGLGSRWRCATRPSGMPTHR
jgi:hypothetical protein